MFNRRGTGRPSVYRRLIWIVPALALAGFTLASCASGPQKVAALYGARADDFAALAPGGMAYLWVKLPESRPLLNLFLGENSGGKQTVEILDHTESAVAALYEASGGSARRFLAAARGTYPNANLALALSAGWKKTKSPTGLSYWHSSQAGLSVALGAGQAFVSDGDPFVLQPGVAVPETFAAMREGAAAAGWLPGAEPLNRYLGALGIPIEIPADRVLFGLYPVDGAGEFRAEAVFRLETPSVSQARALAAIFSMAHLVLGNLDRTDSASSFALLLFANPPELDGKALIIHAGILDETGLALLLSLFSVSLNPM
jgi:hypothetical protein